MSIRKNGPGYYFGNYVGIIIRHLDISIFGCPLCKTDQTECAPAIVQAAWDQQEEESDSEDSLAVTEFEFEG